MCFKGYWTNSKFKDIDYYWLLNVNLEDPNHCNSKWKVYCSFSTLFALNIDETRQHLATCHLKCTSIPNTATFVIDHVWGVPRLNSFPMWSLINWPINGLKLWFPLNCTQNWTTRTACRQADSSSRMHKSIFYSMTLCIEYDIPAQGDFRRYRFWVINIIWLAWNFKHLFVSPLATSPISNLNRF